MRRSLRSIRTGLGSRGGLGHRWGDVDAEAWRDRMRAWRAANAEYRLRDNERRAVAKRTAQLERDRREVDELVTRLTTASRCRAA